MERYKIKALNQNETFEYNLIAKILHWLLAIFLIGMLTLGWYMVSIDNEPRSDWYFNLHKSLGLIAALLILY